MACSANQEGVFLPLDQLEASYFAFGKKKKKKKKDNIPALSTCQHSAILPSLSVLIYQNFT